MTPAAATMDSVALRDHAKQMLEAIAKDIQTAQTDSEQALKSKGLGPVLLGVETAAAAHGQGRFRPLAGARAQTGLAWGIAGNHAHTRKARRSMPFAPVRESP